MIENMTKRSRILIKILLDICSFLCPIVGIGRIVKKKGGSVGAKIVTSVMFAILWAYAASLFFFIFWTFYNSVRTSDEFLTDMLALPTVWDFGNYLEAYQYIEYNEVDFIGMFFNSIWFSVGSSAITIFFHAVTGYIFAKYEFPGREVAFKVILFTLALPIVGSLPSMYKVVYGLSLEESPLFLLTYTSGFGANFLVMYSYFKGVDKTYMEAADMDGAGRFCIFFNIMLPLAFAPCFSLFLLTFIGQWNNYETALLFLDTLPTLSSGLYQFSEIMRFSDCTSPETVYFAGVLIASLPVVLIVIFFGDKIMSNVSMGGIKG